MPRIDLRSDTVTLPTPAMYAAIAAAPLGDDVLGHDPTVYQLEQAAAARFGKEAALFFPSGTQANQTAVWAHTTDGQEVILGRMSHIYRYEVAGAAVHARLQTRPVPEHEGHLRWQDIQPELQTATVHSPGTGLICLENTHNVLGGRLFPLPEMQRVGREAKARGIPVHLDGARIFNAQIASGIDVRDYAACADTVMFCLSKGLGSPVGSLLVGPAALLERGKRLRKALGGGMRQSGILAACGLVSLNEMVDRLAEDHTRARRLAAGLVESGLIQPLDLATVESNIVIAYLSESIHEPISIQDQLAKHGLDCIVFPPNVMRLVTHKEIDDEAVEEAIAILHRVAAELRLASRAVA